MACAFINSSLDYRMDQKAIRDRLVSNGQKRFRAKPELSNFTSIPEANELINDLENHPHAYVLACIMDRQIRAERAWLIPYEISCRLDGEFSMETLSNLTQRKINSLMKNPKPLHRFVDKMSGCFHSGIQRINEHYGGNASLIWNDKPSSADVVYRFLEFDGVGPKIATMATNILARNFKVKFSDYFSIDISADVHVRRVFGRLGLSPVNATLDQVIFRARGLNPTFPGILDFPCWEIGRNWCKPKNPECSNCCMDEICPKVGLKKRTR